MSKHPPSSEKGSILTYCIQEDKMCLRELVMLTNLLKSRCTSVCTRVCCFNLNSMNTLNKDFDISANLCHFGHNCSCCALAGCPAGLQPSLPCLLGLEQNSTLVLFSLLTLVPKLLGFYWARFSDSLHSCLCRRGSIPRGRACVSIVLWLCRYLVSTAKGWGRREVGGGGILCCP